MSRSASRLTSGLSSTPRTTLKIAALAPIPSASVRTTVMVNPLARASDRRAKRRSVIQLMLVAGARDGPTHSLSDNSRTTRRDLDNRSDSRKRLQSGFRLSPAQGLPVAVGPLVSEIGQVGVLRRKQPV